MNFYINDTSAYHRKGLETLGWELTVCNSLEPENSPCRKILIRPGTFGELLIPLLTRFIDPDLINSFIEVGGGYGYISRDILREYPGKKAAMLDISPWLLEKQKESLTGLNAEFHLMDFFKADDAFLQKFDLAVFNENIGDFPAACRLTPELLRQEDHPAVREAAQFIEKYRLEIPDRPFDLNTGAIKAVSRICSAGIKAAYFSEHSAEAVAPARFSKFIDTGSTGFPEKIKLKDHDEYTIKFSHLVQVAEFYGYTVCRGSYLDFIEPADTPLLNFILTSGSSKDEHEIIRHFVEDLCKYEYIIVSNQ